MKILKLHSPEGNEVYVNIKKVYVVEQYKYGAAKLTRLYMSNYSQSVLEKPEEIFNDTPVPASVIYTRSVIFKKELERGNGNTCGT